MPPPPSHNAIRFSVVIPHLNQPDFLARCLRSLATGRRLPDEIVVVDNGSHDMPEAICAAHPQVRLLKETTPGPGPARNRGIAETTGDVLAFIDADCLADPNWLAEAEAAMADPKAQILGGDVRIAYEDPAKLTMLEAYESIYAYRMDRYIAREGFTGTGNLVVRRAVLEAVGPFGGLDVAEDRDWGQRATRQGFDLRYVAGMKVYHPARKSFSELRRKWDRHMAHIFVHSRKSRAWQAKWLLRTVAMAVSPLGEIPRIVASDRISGPAPRVKAFIGLTRIRLYRATRMLWLMAGGDPARLSGTWNRE